MDKLERKKPTTGYREKNGSLRGKESLEGLRGCWKVSIRGDEKNSELLLVMYAKLLFSPCPE